MSVYSGPADWWTDGTDRGRSYIATKGIVQNGLVLNLDAGASTSYAGSGTTWSDLSGNENNGTLTNGVAYNSTGTMVFDGVNDYAILPLNFINYPTLNTFTISLWYNSTQTNGGTIFAQQSSNLPDNPGGWVPVVYLQSNGLIRVEPFWTGASSNAILSSSSLNNGVWYNIVTTFNGSLNQLFVNGIYNSQRTGLTLASYTSTYYYIIGAGSAAGRSLGTNYFNGSISTFNFYNRVLSDSEIRQNFNALRGRYGI
jgi:hypothetical protein